MASLIERMSNARPGWAVSGYNAQTREAKLEPVWILRGDARSGYTVKYRNGRIRSGLTGSYVLDRDVRPITGDRASHFLTGARTGAARRKPQRVKKRTTLEQESRRRSRDAKQQRRNKGGQFTATRRKK